ncbi:hypothetical protein [Streptomyces paradoxus]|uniref:hypothetical protein n=1 Tax=Streptomyces paradoxus TaxID=66375 RepID=UPI003806061D
MSGRTASKTNMLIRPTTGQDQDFRRLTSHDALGRARMQILDRDWKVCSQEPAVGAKVSTNTELDFGVVKLKESCPAEHQAEPSAVGGTMSNFPLLAIVVSADLVIMAVATGWSHEPIIEEAVAGLAFDDLGGGLLVTMSLCGAGTILALLVLLTKAWPRFLLTRLVLAAQRRLPWRLMGFLADARRRQLLRQSGGTYQFRHVRLQERLASRSLAEDREPPDPSVVTRRRRRLTVTVAVVIVALCLILSKALPIDTSQATSIAGASTA